MKCLLYSVELLRNGYLRENKLNISDVTYIGPNYWKLDENRNEVINWRTMLGMSIASTLISISFAMIVIFATLSYKEVSKLTELTSHSEKFRSIQLQLLNSLVLQSLVPAFFIQLPSFVLFLAPFFHCGRPVFGEIIGVTVALYPVLDSLPTILVIKAFREAIFRE
nr:hypothetical protein R09E12.4 - Caenorhabditis elegans [Caenorhabditis elegans]